MCLLPGPAPGRWSHSQRMPQPGPAPRPWRSRRRSLRQPGRWPQPGHQGPWRRPGPEPGRPHCHPPTRLRGDTQAGDGASAIGRMGVVEARPCFGAAIAAAMAMLGRAGWAAGGRKGRVAAAGAGQLPRQQIFRIWPSPARKRGKLSSSSDQGGRISAPAAGLAAGGPRPETRPLTHLARRPAPERPHQRPRRGLERRHRPRCRGACGLLGKRGGSTGEPACRHPCHLHPGREDRRGAAARRPPQQLTGDGGRAGCQ